MLANLCQSTISFAQQKQLHEKPPPNAKDKGFYITSTDHEDGRHHEVIGFEADNAEQSAKIVSQIKEDLLPTLENDPNTKVEVHVRMGSGDVETEKKLDYEAFAIGKDIASTDERITLSHANVPTDPLIKQAFNKQHFFEKNYRMSFALVRGSISWGITTWYLIVTAQLPLEVAASIGFLAGAMSFSLQKWADPLFYWAVDKIEKDGVLARTLGRYRDPKTATIWNKIESYGRLYIVEVIYVGVIKAAIVAFGPDHTFDPMEAINHVLITALWGFTQDAWDLTFTETRARLERLGELSKNQIKFRTNFKYLGSAAASTMLLMAQLLYVPNVEYGYITMGVLGGIAYLNTLRRSKLSRTQIQENAQKPKLSVRCEILVKKLAP